MKVDYEAIAAYKEYNPWISNVQIAKHFNTSESTVRRAIAKKPSIEKYYEKKWAELEKAITVVQEKKQKWAWIADTHIPLVSGPYLNWFLKFCKKHKITHLGIGGDLVNADSLSRWEPKQENAGMDREVPETRAIMLKLLKQFVQVFYFPGNHDLRYSISTRYKLKFTDVIRQRVFYGEKFDKAIEEGRLVISNLEFANFTDAKGREWYICHPVQYSTIPLANGRKIASVKQKNVITFHSHHCAQGTDVSGKYIIIEGGGLFDKDATEYLRKPTSYPEWVQGFVWFNEAGNPKLESPLWSDDL